MDTCREALFLWFLGRAHDFVPERPDPTPGLPFPPDGDLPPSIPGSGSEGGGGDDDDDRDKDKEEA
jgi:hypothetical protein